MLEQSFFERDTVVVARELIGQTLCREMEGIVHRLPITEVEAYDGPEDRACHARAGRTARTDIMFGPGGYWYIYLCYGIHWLANIVTGSEGYPSAVLLRGAGPLCGPGRLTKKLKVTGSLNRAAAHPASGFWIEAAEQVDPQSIKAGPRIGVDYAGTEWAIKPYRFVWSGMWGKAAVITG